MKKTIILLFSLNLLLAYFLKSYAQEVSPVDSKASKDISLEDIWINYTFYPAGIDGLLSMKDGIHYTVQEENGINQYGYEKGNLVKTILDTKKLTDPITKKEIKIEDYVFSNDESKILLFSETERIYRYSKKNKNYIWDIKAEKLSVVADGKTQQLADFSPDGKKLAYVRDNNLFIFDIASQIEEQITFTGEKNKIINGAPDWVYEEEFSFSKGFYWSPDSKRIAYLTFDESNVKEWSMTMWGELYPENYNYKYPKAGEDNSIVNVFIYNVEIKDNIKSDIGSETDQYIPRIKWTNNPEILCITRLNRLQNKLELLLTDASNGSSKVILTEENKYYIDITDHLTFLKDNKQFLWTSEADGFNHIYLYTLEGKLVNQLTKGNWDIVSLIGVDEASKLVYYSAAAVSATQREIYSVSLNGKKTNLLSTKKGTNEAQFSATFKYMINTWSDANTPPYISVNKPNGKEIRALETNEALRIKLEDYRFCKKEFFTIKTSEGIELNAWMIKPYNFTATRKYPVFMTCYGGPGANTVNDNWDYSDLWAQVLAAKGYIVVSVDNRGTGYRGQEFRKSTYQQLGMLETIDQIASAKYLGELEYVDKTRIGIQGWSFGGYLSTLCILKGADVFKMAIAVAPVTNWRYYDNIYTERFLRKPQDNPTGYDDNSPINFAKALKGKYLIIHGTADDNVHIQNTMEMVRALNAANKQFDMHLYPNKNHSIYGGYTRYHLFNKMTNYIFENL